MESFIISVIFSHLIFSLPFFYLLKQQYHPILLTKASLPIYNPTLSFDQYSQTPIIYPRLNPHTTITIIITTTIITITIITIAIITTLKQHQRFFQKI
ncbi:hypothetical protein [Helicobacter kayseriensis]|uniref:hypothetical protein n=1 Tax=Helicobacter kayseriensis TaxID=2905877 RepID=UPI001E39DF0C|nr:hypothetical protein [Helicobacter kayseriensis]MCE3047802.1 hypothetical protein [Helicobacter kayseriensis]MCE3049167.1 hypothetical protein [Helicobacter kayseriensis]